MAIHTIAFAGSVTGSNGNVPAVEDGVLSLRGEGILPREKSLLVAAAAGATSLDSAQVFQPSMDITPANIHPVNTFPWPSPTGALYNGRYAPRLARQEALVARAAGGMTDAAIVAWLSDGVEPAPEGESFLLAFSTEGGKTVPALTWNRLEIKWAVQFLPVGRYHILGMDASVQSGSNIVAARLYLPNQLYRPGTLVMSNPRDLPPPFLMDGCLGSWGWFEQRNPPKVEVLALSSGTHNIGGHLRVVKASTTTPAGASGASWG